MSIASDVMPVPSEELTGDYRLDPAHTRIGFVARHALVTKVRGQFHEFDGGAHLDAADPTTSRAWLTIKGASIDTGNGQRDAHLRTNDFLDLENHPEINFVSTAVEKIDAQHYRLTGDLTIRGATRPVSVDFEYAGFAKDPFGNLRAGFEGRTTINRKDWRVNWNVALEAGGMLVSEKVTLEFDVSAIKVQS